MKYLLILTLFIFNLNASEAFISPNELKNSLENENLIIIDVAVLSTYKTSHIKGAINCNVSNFINPESLYSQMNPIEIIQNELKELGINKNSKVVIYSHNTKKGVLNSSYLAFILIYSGFENLSILDGGYMSWLFENELLTSSDSSYASSEGNFTININQNIVVSSDIVLNTLTSTIKLDARSPQMYYGTQRSENVASVGHIKYAKSSYYADKFLRDGILRDQEELNEIFIDGHELKSTDEIIVYSDNVFSASMEFYILYKHMGFNNAKIYEASLLEWGNALDLPMTRFKWE
ncbi:MAG: thiosulfate/3-mercaptopyruvate sulfurtransferase [Sulfurimonas sp.]|jgi:thiosulfate/3-mercaptopyruvate sulfurtransferase